MGHDEYGTFLSRHMLDPPLGEDFQWISREHCLVLLGADDSCYYFNDPYQSHGRIAYDREVVEQRYRELGRQSVIVINAK